MVAHHQHLILMAAVLLLLSNYTTMAEYHGRGYYKMVHSMNSTTLLSNNYTITPVLDQGGLRFITTFLSDYYTIAPILDHGGRRYIHSMIQKEKVVRFLSNYSRAQGLEERLDEKARRSLALAVLDDDLSDSSSFSHLISICYKDTYIIHPETKELVLVYIYAFPHIQNLFRCGSYGRCGNGGRPAAITEANWRRYEAAVKRPTHLWITSLDVSNCRLWLEANPPLPPL